MGAALQVSTSFLKRLHGSHPWTIWVAIGLMACLLRLGFSAQVPPDREWGDAAIYDTIAINLLAGEIRYEAIVSSANKCIEGVPGFGFVLALRECL